MRNAVLAAGGIIWRPTSGPDAVEVLLAHRPRYDDWTFPKGKVQLDESLLSAAVREVAEETGLSVTVGHRMPSVGYATADGPKEVTYWVMQPNGGGFAPNDEVDAVRWTSINKAGRALSYAHDRRLVDELADLPPGIVRVVLVRHADAGRRSDYRGPDESRPLTERGMRQAEQLLPLLSCFAPTRLLSAPALRCRQTLEPLSRSTGIGVQDAPMFGEDEFATDAQETAHQLLADLGRTGDVTVIVSQGGVIPELLAWLAPSGAPEPERQIAAKAGVWALAFGAGRVRADYYPPSRH